MNRMLVSSARYAVEDVSRLKFGYVRFLALIELGVHLAIDFICFCHGSINRSAIVVQGSRFNSQPVITTHFTFQTCIFFYKSTRRT
jgi:hypothetical protein